MIGTFVFLLFISSLDLEAATRRCLRAASPPLSSDSSELELSKSGRGACLACMTAYRKTTRASSGYDDGEGNEGESPYDQACCLAFK